MTFVQSFSAVTPPPRYDDVPWTNLEVWESETETGTYALIDTQAIAVDATPETPDSVEITTTLAEFPVGWYRFRFKDATPNYSNFTNPVLAPAGADGSVYFTVAELRAKYPVELTDPARWPDAVIAAAITRAEQVIEGPKACDIAFVPREATVAISSIDLSGLLALPNNHVREVTAATASTTGDLDLTDVRVIAGSYLEHPTGWPAGETITVTYTHGYDDPPLRILEAAKLYTRQLVIDGPIDERATQIRTAEGIISMVTPGQRGSITGIPEVDAAIDQYNERGFFA